MSNCNESNKSLIIKIEYIDSDYIDDGLYNTFTRDYPLSKSTVINEDNEQYVKTLILDIESAQLSSSQVRTTGGIKYKNELKFNVSIPSEDASNEFAQQLEMMQSTFSLIITYFGGGQSFIYSPKNCMLYSFEQKGGKYECTIVIENLTEIQPMLV